MTTPMTAREALKAIESYEACPAADDGSCDFPHDALATIRDALDAAEARESTFDLMRADLQRIVEALGIPARPYSGHEAMDRDILPAIEAHQARVAELEAALGCWRDIYTLPWTEFNVKYDLSKGSPWERFTEMANNAIASAASTAGTGGE